MLVPKNNQLKYLVRRKREIILMQKDLLAGSFELALQVGHQIKGNALTFGFPQFASLGQQLENAAINEDSFWATSIVSELKIRIEETLRKFLTLDF
ncbi:MAG: Hpt domain-containing protein [Bacteriovoracaceae bacterium]